MGSAVGVQSSRASVPAVNVSNALLVPDYKLPQNKSSR